MDDASVYSPTGTDDMDINSEAVDSPIPQPPTPEQPTRAWNETERSIFGSSLTSWTFGAAPEIDGASPVGTQDEASDTRMDLDEPLVSRQPAPVGGDSEIMGENFYSEIAASLYGENLDIEGLNNEGLPTTHPTGVDDMGRAM
jgi:hypothetical protein